jgi:hypothetical protein
MVWCPAYSRMVRYPEAKPTRQSNTDRQEPQLKVL